jgi:DNA-binding NtrC family response regulator
VDDEARMAEAIAMMLRRDGHEVTFFTSPKDFLASFEDTSFDLLLTDLKMPGIDGVELLRRVKAVRPALPVILMTAYGTIKTAVAAIREGAFDYLEKPFDNQLCKRLVSRALELTRLERENRILREECKQLYALDHLIAVSPQMKEVLALTRRAARGRSTVLISGESGTGKEVIAKAIHYYSDRVGKPHLAVNCKAFAPGVLESELFGHEKGAFTGALQTRPGVFERADGGTLFLDEIGDIDASFQAKLLRVLQEREVLRVGGETPIPVDVRVVAATNLDLQAEVQAGRFREDLYFRLAVIPISLAPLRERTEDILPLARHFLTRWNRELQRDITGWSQEVEDYFLKHTWPGNIRELENAIERAVVLARDAILALSDVALSPLEEKNEDLSISINPALTLHEFLDQMATERIRQVLREVRGVRVDAARVLGVERTTLYRLMKKFGIEDDDFL